MNSTAEQIASMMLATEIKDLDPDLRRMLLRATELVNKLDGDIGSRQIVAVIITAWESGRRL